MKLQKQKQKLNHFLDNIATIDLAFNNRATAERFLEKNPESYGKSSLLKPKIDHKYLLHLEIR